MFMNWFSETIEIIVPPGSFYPFLLANIDILAQYNGLVPIGKSMINQLAAGSHELIDLLKNRWGF